MGLREEIKEVLRAAGRPKDIAYITRKVTATRHETRVGIEVRAMVDRNELLQADGKNKKPHPFYTVRGYVDDE